MSSVKPPEEIWCVQLGEDVGPSVNAIREQAGIGAVERRSRKSVEGHIPVEDQVYTAVRHLPSGVEHDAEGNGGLQVHRELSIGGDRCVKRRMAHRLGARHIDILEILRRELSILRVGLLYPGGSQYDKLRHGRLTGLLPGGDFGPRLNLARDRQGSVDAPVDSQIRPDRDNTRHAEGCTREAVKANHLDIAGGIMQLCHCFQVEGRDNVSIVLEVKIRLTEVGRES